VNATLIVLRAIHFASTAMTAGVLIFLTAVADPVLRREGASEAQSALRTRSLRIVWATLALTVLSGAAWLLLQAAAMSGRPLVEAIADGVVFVVLSKTQFGMISSLRFALVILLMVSLMVARARSWAWFMAATLAAGLVAAIAWTGHAAGTVGTKAPIHLACDALHLVAAAAWIGSLVPLGLLLRWARLKGGEHGLSIAAQAARRFSALGIISVGVLLASGLVNSWILVGSVAGLTGTDYGRLVVAKLALFAAMVSIAAVNRTRLTPRLFETAGSGMPVNAMRQLSRNITIELVLGLSIFAVVGALGTLHPAIHLL
jgi:putative copper resistance protein D